MGCKLPVFKKFCFCIPIRYGFLIWGYISLVASFLFLCWEIKDAINILLKKKQDGSILLESFDVIMIIGNMGFIILFIVAVHKNNVKLLKLSLKCNLSSVIFYTLYCIYMFTYCFHMLNFLYQLSGWSSIEPFVWKIVLLAFAAAIEILVKFYVMLILSNEIKKLETNDCQFRYVIGAAEAKCTMQREEKIKNIEDEEKGVQDTFDKRSEEEEIEETYQKEECNYSLNNMTETKYMMEWNVKE